MKKSILLLLAILVSGLTYAQTGTAKGFNYKGLVTNNGNVVANAVIGVKIKLKHGSSVKWYEEHTGVHTDANGIFSVNIGEGTKIGGSFVNFSYVDWQGYPDMKISVEIDSGTGYHTYVNDIPLKSVPYAKFADKSYFASRLLPQTDGGIKLSTTTGSRLHGYILEKGSDDWYTYINSGSNYVINNDGVDVLKISDADNSVWMKGELIKPFGSDNGVKFYSSSSGTGYYKFATSTGSLNLQYNGGGGSTTTGLKFHGSASVEVMKKLRAPDSGDSDMKAYIYGKVYANGTLPGSPTPNSDGYSVTKIGTGNYKITFDTSPGHYNKYLVIATRYRNGSGSTPGFIQVQSENGYFNVFTYDASGNPADRSFMFVVYKK